MKKVLILTVVFLGACSQDKVSFATLEDARGQARENVTHVAQAYRAENKLTEYDLLVRGDSTQNSTCPQGDGWSSVDLTSKSTKETIKLKCSTVSLNLSCLVEADFKSKSYASDDGHCNKELPFPLPKLVK